LLTPLSCCAKVRITMSIPARPRFGPNYVLAILTVGYVLNALDRSIVMVLLEPIGREFGASDTQLGLLTGLAFAAVYSLCSVPIAAYADRHGRRNVLAIGMLFWSVMTAACGLAPALLWLLFARMGTAAGEAAGTPTSHALICELFPASRRATALAVYSIGAPAGTALAGLLGGMGADWFGWRMTMLVAAIPGLVLASIILLTIEDPVRPYVLPKDGAPRRPWLQDVRELWPHPVFRHLWLGTALHGMAIYSAAGFNAAWLMRTRGWSASEAGSLIALVGCAGALGVFLGGWSADRLSVRLNDSRWTLRVATITTLLAIPFQFAAYLAPGIHWIVVALPLAGFFGNGFFAPAFASAQTIARPEARATAAAVLVLAMGIIGMGFGPIITGMLSDALAPWAGDSSLRLALLFAPAANLWAAAHFYVAARRS
jgi:MFS family permease